MSISKRPAVKDVRTVAVVIDDLVVDVPNYEFCYGSPRFEPEEFGIRASFHSRKDQLTGAPTGVSMVHGSYALDEDELVDLGINPLCRVSMTITHHRTGRAKVFPIIQGPRSMAAARLGRLDIKTPSSTRGFFNLDLTETCLKIAGAGAYWVVFNLGRHLSKPLVLDLNDRESLGLDNRVTEPETAEAVAIHPLDSSATDAFGKDEDPTRVDHETLQETRGGDDAFGADQETLTITPKVPEALNDE